MNHKPIFFTSFQIFQHFPRIEDPSENVGHIEMQPFLSFFRQLRVLFRHVVVFVAQPDPLKALWGSKQKKVKFGNRPYNNLDIKLLSHGKFFHHMYYRFLQKALKLKNAKKIAKKFFEKSSNPHGVSISYQNRQKLLH